MANGRCQMAMAEDKRLGQRRFFAQAMRIFLVKRLAFSLRSGEDFFEEGGGGGVFDAEDVFGRAAVEELAAAVATAGAEFDEPVGLGNDVEVVFDDDHGVAGVNKAVEEVEEAGDIVAVEADAGFFEEVEGFAGVGAGEFGDEFEALGFAAGEGGGALAKGEVAEAGVAQEAEGAMKGGVGGEEVAGFFDGHGKDVGDVFAFVADVEGGGVVAGAVAVGAGHGGGGEEVHLEALFAKAFAGGAAALGGVVGEAGDAVAAGFAFGEGGEEGADGVEDAGVGGGGGSGGFADGGLIDFDDGGDAVGTGECGLLWAAGCFGWEGFFVEVCADDRGEDFADEGGFAGAGGAADDGEATAGDGEGEVADVVGGGVGEDDVGGVGAGSAGAAQGVAEGFAKEAGGGGFCAGGELSPVACGDDVAAVDAGAGAEVNDVVGGAHGVFVVFDEEEGVAALAEAGEEF
jgi:hypothetical protein